VNFKQFSHLTTVITDTLTCAKFYLLAQSGRFKFLLYCQNAHRVIVLVVFDPCNLVNSALNVHV